MSSRTQTTEVLLSWKYVRKAVKLALYTLEQFTISEAQIFRYNTNTRKGTKTKTSYFTKKHQSCWFVDQVGSHPKQTKRRISY